MSGFRLTLLFTAALAAPAPAADWFVIVGGLGGESRYEERFDEEIDAIAKAVESSAGDPSHVRTLRGDEARLESIEKAFAELKEKLQPSDTLAVFLVGHGSDDGETYKFNIPGPDITDQRLAELLAETPAERQLVVNTTSSSGGSLEGLEAKGRAVITATKSGRERTATIFGKYWAEALGSPEADVDKNEIVSAEEAFRYAEAKVETFFGDNNLLATEHPQLQGSSAGGFALVRLGQAAEALNDPELQPLVRKREELEAKIESFKLRKDAIAEEEYFDQLQELLVDLALVQEEISAGGSAPAPPAEAPGGQP